MSFKFDGFQCTEFVDANVFQKRGRRIDVLNEFLCIFFEWKEKTIRSVHIIDD